MDQAQLPLVPVSPPVAATVRTGRGGMKTVAWDWGTGILPALAMLPLLALQCVSVWQRPHMQYFPIVLLLVLLISFFKLPSAPCTDLARMRLAIGWFVASAGLFVVAVLVYSPWLAHLSAISIFFAWGLGRAQNVAWPRVAAIALLAACTLPWPRNLDYQLDAWLKSLVGSYVSGMMDAFAVPHLLTPISLQTERVTLSLSELTTQASVFALVACACLLALLRSRSFLQAVLLCLSTCVWYVVAGCLVVLIWSTWWPELESRYLQWLIFAVATACLLSFDMFLSLALTPAPVTDPDLESAFVLANKMVSWPHADPFESLDGGDQQPQDVKPIDSPGPPTIVQWSSWPAARWLVGFGLALLLISGVPPMLLFLRGDLFSRPGSLPLVSPEVMATIAGKPEFSELPPQFGAWTLEQFNGVESPPGEPALLTWSFRWRGQFVNAQLSFPHAGWSGTVDAGADLGRQLQAATTTSRGNVAWNLSAAQFVNSLGGSSYVMQTALDDSLQPVDPNGSQRLNRLDESRLPIVRQLSPMREPIKPTYRIMASCETGGSLTEPEFSELKNSFEAFCNALRLALRPEQLTAT